MKKNKISIENLPSQEEYERILLESGRKVLQTISTDGWVIIEKKLEVTKEQAELDRMKCLKTNATRENALYWCGVVDGIKQAMRDIYEIVAQAKAIESKNEMIRDIE